MKLFYMILVIFLSGCSVQGNVVSSQGLVKGWEYSGFRSIKNGVEVIFYAENDAYISLNEKLVGVTTKDRKAGMTPVIGKKPFLIIVKVKTINADVYIKQNAKLILDGKEYLPNKVKKGVDKVVSGRISDDVIASNYDDFMHVNNMLEGIDHNWLWLEFDMAAPHPSQKFTLFVEMKNGGNEEILEANFNSKEMSIYHH